MLKRTALIDGDLLVHEIAVLGQYIDEEGVLQVLPFSYLEEIFVTRVEEILEASNCNSKPEIWLTGKNNFRYAVAKTVPYKGNRKGKDKPVHYENVKWFAISRYKAKTVQGMEADDVLAIRQTASMLWSVDGDPHYDDSTTVICTRDKDIPQVAGWHYGWEVGKQPERALHWVKPLGALKATYKERVSQKTGKVSTPFDKLTGTGYIWFCAQALIGDSTDDIPGCKGVGKGKAYDLLKSCKDEASCLEVLKTTYKEVYGEGWEEHLIEQARLVWMVRHVHPNGAPVMWELDYGR